MKQNIFDDLINQERKISLSEFRDFFYELKKVHDSILLKKDLEIEDLKKQKRIIANMIESK
jgi:hypothetical protein